MTKWEIIESSSWAEASVLSRDGWELVSAIHLGEGHFRYFLKRSQVLIESVYKKKR